MRRLIAALLLVTSATTIAAPQPSRLTQHWQPQDKDSTATIVHSAFTAFLNKYLLVRDDKPNLVRYAKVGAGGRKALESYIHTMTQVPLGEYNRNQQLAYWINLYNAALIDLVLEHYPVDEVADIGGVMASPWEIPVVTIDGIRLTLSDIQHQILQPIWHEPLVHYGLTWAALGGPELRASAYDGADIYLQLRNSAERFVNSPQGMTIKKDRLIVSRLFDWYRHDFGRSVTALISELRAHAAPALSARLDIFDKIAGYRFDWQLNDASRLQK